VHSISEDELFQQVCHAAVQFGGMKMAWIGIIEVGSGKILPVSSYGDDTEYLKNLNYSVDVASPFGHGSTGTAIREGRPFWCQDFLTDPTTAPWHERAALAGVAASASLPLHSKGIVIGAFTLYSSEANAFDELARDLLIEMALDISFALGNFDRELQRRQAVDDIERLAFYDPLTSLPNRRLLHDRLKHTLDTSAHHHNYSAVLFIDIDNFKALNDIKGHNIGDLLLIDVANRLQVCVSKGDTVARLGGDDFVVILEKLSDEALQAAAETEAVGEKIRAAMSQPFSLKGYEFHCTVSIGINLFRDQKTTVEEQLKRADIAMYQAKDAGRNNMRFYDPALQAALEDRMAMEKDLHSALAENQFRLYYQMQVDHTGHIIGAEGLLRWQHPQRGLVSPLLFIPLAEDTGLILHTGEWVLETACAQIKAWEADPLTRDLQLSINVSARQFRQLDFVGQVRQKILSYTINPDRLKLELTESLVLDNIDDAIEKMRLLRQSGVRFSMDDFGTGYSSLAYLAQLPLDQLKIDQSFVRNIGVKKNDDVIVQTIIGMANNLGMEVIAEGVETEAQRAFLEKHGCPLCQGYLFGRPVPIGEFEERLRKS